MPELRKDPVTNQWVIIAAERALRPDHFSRRDEEKRGGFCPFCPGNERSTPAELLSYRPTNTSKDNEGWWLRVVPNKFPALRPEEPPTRSGEGMYDKITGYGAHEVIIESPDHEHTFADLTVDQVQEIIWAMRDRCIELQKDPQIRYVMIFKNWGSEAGSSQDHPHCQIIALPIVPKQVQEELAGALRYYEYKERCCYCDMIQQELKNNERVVVESDLFVSFMPFASRSAYETWIVPKEHSCFFDQIQKNQVQDLSRILKKTLSLLKESLDDPAYNFVIHTTPYDGTGNVPFYHWHIEIAPKLNRSAGFEWGTGFYINPTPPEQAAKVLRELNNRSTEAGPLPSPRRLSEV